MSFTRANTCANIDDVHGQGSPSVAKRGRDSRKPPGALGDITNFVHVKEKTPPAPPVPNDSQDEKGSSSSLAASSAVVLDPPTAPPAAHEKTVSDDTEESEKPMRLKRQEDVETRSVSPSTLPPRVCFSTAEEALKHFEVAKLKKRGRLIKEDAKNKQVDDFDTLSHALAATMTDCYPDLFPDAVQRECTGHDVASVISLHLDASALEKSEGQPGNFEAGDRGLLY